MIWFRPLGFSVDEFLGLGLRDYDVGYWEYDVTNLGFCVDEVYSLGFRV